MRNLFFKNKPQQYQLQRADFPVPIHVYVEQRKGSRISLLKEKINIRLPLFFSEQNQKKEIDNLLEWAAKRLQKKNIYAKATLQRDYWEDRQIEFYGDVWTIEYVERPNKHNVEAQLIGKTHRVQLVGSFAAYDKNEINATTKSILTKLFKQYYLPKVKKRVAEINAATVQQRYQKVTLKYMNSRWGSCSSKGNINLSVRLLFAPEAVIDYVILHELCHLLEMNHSPRFWNLVEQAMPNYASAEKWLKQHGHECDF